MKFYLFSIDNTHIGIVHVKNLPMKHENITTKANTKRKRGSSMQLIMPDAKRVSINVKLSQGLIVTEADFLWVNYLAIQL